jgi:hypothetical protein
VAWSADVQHSSMGRMGANLPIFNRAIRERNLDGAHGAGDGLQTSAALEMARGESPPGPAVGVPDR